ncbi:MAG: hypothetical protein J6I66_11915 [Lachnospiraceae bacterium]|nr:hypothetical protein [Lachnospiraceae bacterium]
MKKFTVVFAAAVMAVSLAACGAEEPAQVPEEVTEEVTEVEEAVEADAEDADAEDADADADADADTTEESDVVVMSYDEFVAADVDTEVVVETYVQDKQGWWENEGVGMATFYTQDKDGAYFLYNMPCSQEDYDAMVTGTKIRVTGFKSEWSGEVEIIDATYEILADDTYVAEATDLTDKIADADALADYMNQYVSFTGLTVAEREGAAFTYGWDGSKSQGDDLYFNLEDADGNVYTFVVESYLRGADTDVYQAVEAFNVGDTVDITGFMYWYEGPQVHVTVATVK